MIDPKDCMHERLMFGSGDYYLFCSHCNASWVRRGNDDKARPDLANTGVGAALSGEVRAKIMRV